MIYKFPNKKNDIKGNIDQFCHCQYVEKFKILIFNSFFTDLDDNRLLSAHQSGICCKDSCVPKLLKIVHKI